MTTPLGFRYPASGAAPNVPQDLQNLATDIDTYLQGQASYSWVTSSTAQSFASGTGGIVNTFASATGATKNITFNAASGTWTITNAGLYRINASVAFASTATPAGIRSADILVNGTQVAEFVTRGDSGYAVPMPLSWVQPLAVGDTVQIQAFHNQGATLALSGFAKQNYASVSRSGAS